MGRNQTALHLQHQQLLNPPVIAFQIFPLSLEASPNSFLHPSTLPHTTPCFLRGKTLQEKREGFNDSNSCSQILPERSRGSATARWHLRWHQEISLALVPQGPSQTEGSPALRSCWDREEKEDKAKNRNEEQS